MATKKKAAKKKAVKTIRFVDFSVKDLLGKRMTYLNRKLKRATNAGNTALARKIAQRQKEFQKAMGKSK